MFCLFVYLPTWELFRELFRKHIILPLPAHLPRGRVAPEVAERVLEPVVDLVECQLLVG